MNKTVKTELEANPLKFYDTVLFLSASEGDKAEQDFAMIGDAGLIQTHLAAMMMRHEMFFGLVAGALVLAETAMSKEG